MNMKSRALALICFSIITAPLSAESAETAQEKTAPNMPHIYIGMSKMALYKAYPLQYKLKDYTKGGYEIIVYDDYLTNEVGDIITFYLKNNKVEWWNKVQTTYEKKIVNNVKLYQGMSKAELYRAYPPKYQLQYYVNGTLEVITFDDYLTEEAGDTITFYVRDGKLEWWDKVQANPTPEDRLKAIMNRNAHREDASLQGDGITDFITYTKQNNRQSNIGGPNLRRDLKGRLQ